MQARAERERDSAKPQAIGRSHQKMRRVIRNAGNKPIFGAASFFKS
jgi:hypothetical protein